MCCDNQMTEAQQAELVHARCCCCNALICNEGFCIELDHCGYSEEVCSICHYQPCMGSC